MSALGDAGRGGNQALVAVEYRMDTATLQSEASERGEL